jgi:hypothetical protein
VFSIKRMTIRLIAGPGARQCGRAHVQSRSPGLYLVTT